MLWKPDPYLVLDPAWLEDLERTLIPMISTSFTTSFTGGISSGSETFW